MEYLVTMTTRVPEATPDEAVEDILDSTEASGECAGSESLR
jgi:muconolactone delta-isomerase